ncbi:MAG: hypothetical protein ACRDV9_00270 [Acidimicrobiia bacterium]
MAFVLEPGADSEAWGYLGSLTVAGFLMGLLWPSELADRQSKAYYVPGLTLAVPSVVLAGPTTPRGDGDGLWVLIFVLVAFAGVLSMFAHQVGVALRRSLRRRERER